MDLLDSMVFDFHVVTFMFSSVQSMEETADTHTHTHDLVKANKCECQPYSDFRELEFLHEYSMNKLVYDLFCCLYNLVFIFCFFFVFMLKATRECICVYVCMCVCIYAVCIAWLSAMDICWSILMYDSILPKNLCSICLSYFIVEYFLWTPDSCTRFCSSSPLFF